MIRRLALVLALLVGAVGCTVAVPTGQAAGPRTPAPLPSGATALSLETAPATTHVPGNWACEGSTPVTLRVARDSDGVVFETDSGERIDLVWPRGFSARLLAGRAEIVAPDGSVVAREGDEIPDGTLSGAGSAGSQPEPRFDICGVNGVYYRPAA